MDPRPRVSRETRLLFTTIIIAIVALWVLARIRFPERPAPTNPVTPVLTQLAPRPAFSDLASAVAEVQPRALLPFVALRLAADAGARSAEAGQEAIAGYRITDDIAVALLPSSADVDASAPVPVLVDGTVINVDRATGLAAVRVQPLARPAVTFWSPAGLEMPRYLLTTTATREGLSLRPVFVSSLAAAHNMLWNASVWAVAPNADLTPGTFVFTSTGTIAGLVIPHDRRHAVLPMAALVTAADRLLQQQQTTPGWLGVDVEPLTPALISATGAPGGTIVTWVYPAGPAAGSLQIGDVLEAIDGSSTTLTDDEWKARTARLSPGESLTIRVRRETMTQPVRLTAAPPPPPPALILGLTMRRVRGGAEVLRVERGSAADRAGMRAGDIVTLAAGIMAPTPAQIARAVALAAGRPIVVGLTRGEEHLVVAVGAP